MTKTKDSMTNRCRIVSSSSLKVNSGTLESWWSREPWTFLSPMERKQLMDKFSNSSWRNSFLRNPEADWLQENIKLDSKKPTGGSRYLPAGISVSSTVSYNCEEIPHLNLQLLSRGGRELVQMSSTPSVLWGLPRGQTSVFLVWECWWDQHNLITYRKIKMLTRANSHCSSSFSWSRMSGGTFLAPSIFLGRKRVGSSV